MQSQRFEEKQNFQWKVSLIILINYLAMDPFILTGRLRTKF